MQNMQLYAEGSVRNYEKATTCTIWCLLEDHYQSASPFEG